MKKVVVGIDFNNICNRAVFTCKYGSDNNIVDYSTEDEQKILFRKICWDVTRMSSMFGASEVYVFADSRIQWRRNVIDNYKGTRQKSTDIDYPSVYKVMAELLKEFPKHGIRVFNIDGAEADDLAAIYRSEMSKDTDKSIVYITSDQDWHQLISFNRDTEQFSIVYNAISSNKGRHLLSVNREFSEWVDSPNIDNPMSIFDDNASIKSQMKNIIDTEENYISINVVDPTEVLLHKILCGDDGDNIPSIYEYYKTDGKKKRVTPSVYKKIRENCKFDDVHTLCECVGNGAFADVVGLVMKRDVDDIDFVDKLKMQRLGVELNVDLFPSHLREDYDVLNEKYGEKYIQLPKYGSDIYKDTPYDDGANESNNFVPKPKLNDSLIDIINRDYKFS